MRNDALGTITTNLLRLRGFEVNPWVSGLGIKRRWHGSSYQPSDALSEPGRLILSPAGIFHESHPRRQESNKGNARF